MARTSFVALGLCLSLPFGGCATDVESGPHRGGFQYNATGAVPGKDDSLYRDLGGQENISAFTIEFVGLISKDDRIGHFFTNVNLDHLGQELTEQFIDLSGGPIKYTGREMAEVHGSLGITNADFNRLAEDLQVAMNHHNVPFATQNRLIALLASMQRVVVTK